MPSKPKATNYHELTAELQELLANLEAGELDIDQSVASYERGLEIIAQLESRLASAENKVSELRAQLTKDAET